MASWTTPTNGWINPSEETPNSLTWTMTTKIVTTSPSPQNWVATTVSMYNGIKAAFTEHGWWTNVTDTYNWAYHFVLKYTHSTEQIDWEPITLCFFSSFVSEWRWFWVSLFAGYAANWTEYYTDWYSVQTSPTANVDYGWGNTPLLGFNSWEVLVSDRYAILISNDNDYQFQSGIVATWDIITYVDPQWLAWTKKLASFAAWTWSDVSSRSNTVKHWFDVHGNEAAVSFNVLNNNDNIRKNANVERGQYEILLPAYVNMNSNIGYMGKLLDWVFYKIQQPVSFIGWHWFKATINGHVYKRALDHNNGIVWKLAVLWEETV